MRVLIFEKIIQLNNYFQKNCFFFFQLMQTRRKAVRSKPRTTFTNYNNESENYDSEDDTELNNLQNQILQTKHPFETNGFTDGKPISVLQKVITYYINKCGGWAHEKKIFQFINDNWADISQISKKRFQKQPKIRLLHTNLLAKKKGQDLFVKKSPTSFMYRINTGNDDIPETTEEQKREDDIDILEEEEDMNEDEIKAEYQSNEEEYDTPDEIDTKASNFESSLLLILQNQNKSMLESEIIKKATPLATQPGLFQSLNINWRVRACLLHLKSQHEVFADETEEGDVWSLRPVVHQQSSILFTDDEFRSFLPSGASDMAMNVSLHDLLRRCRTFKNQCFP